MIKFNNEYYRAIFVGVICVAIGFTQLNYFVSLIISILVTLVYCYVYRKDIKEIFLNKGGASEK